MSGDTTKSIADMCWLRVAASFRSPSAAVKIFWPALAMLAMCADVLSDMAEDMLMPTALQTGSWPTTILTVSMPDDFAHAGC